MAGSRCSKPTLAAEELSEKALLLLCSFGKCSGAPHRPGVGTLPSLGCDHGGLCWWGLSHLVVPGRHGGCSFGLSLQPRTKNLEGGFKGQKCMVSQSGGWRSRIKVLAGPRSLKPIGRTLPASFQLLEGGCHHHGRDMVYRCISQSYVSTWPSPCVSSRSLPCPSVSTFPLPVRTPSYWIRLP